jgi:hypothetical protein
VNGFCKKFITQIFSTTIICNFISSAQKFMKFCYFFQRLTSEMKSLVITGPAAPNSANQYASCPQLVKGQKPPPPEESNELQALKRFTAKYDSYQGLIQAANQRPDSPLGSDEPSMVTDQERMQTESFFRGLKTQVYVSNTLANLYFGTATHAPSPG